MSNRYPQASFQDAVLIQAEPYSGLPPFFFHSTGQSLSNVFPTRILLSHPIAGHCSQDFGHWSLMATNFSPFLFCVFFVCQHSFLHKEATDVYSMSLVHHSHVTVTWLMAKDLVPHTFHTAYWILLPSGGLATTISGPHYTGPRNWQTLETLYKANINAKHRN
jgi:hypothetical protein